MSFSYEGWHTTQKELLENHVCKITPELDSFIRALKSLLEEHGRKQSKDDDRESTPNSMRILDMVKEVEKQVEQCQKR